MEEAGTARQAERKASVIRRHVHERDAVVALPSTRMQVFYARSSQPKTICLQPLYGSLSSSICV